MPEKVVLFGEVKCPTAYLIRDFLQRNGFPFQWIEISSVEDARALLAVDSLPLNQVPILTVGAKRLYAPTLQEVTMALGWSMSPSCKEYDVAIYGAGPAGLSAAVNAASEGLKTVLVERFAIGGQAGSTSRIENYLGFPNGLSGAELASRAREQALRFGVEIVLAAESIDGRKEGGHFIGILDSGQLITSKAVICATGIEYSLLNVPNEGRFIGRGLYYGAGSSEANLCQGHVFVIGGGNSAGQAALHLASRVNRVTMLVRGKSLKDTLSQYLIDRIHLSPNIEVKTRTITTRIAGEMCLETIAYKNLETGEETEEATGWVFVCVGGRPRTEVTGSTSVARDAAGYFLTGMDLLPRDGSLIHWRFPRNPYLMEMSIPGAFAVGDIRSNSIKRCAAAVGEGAIAVASVHRYLADG